MIRWMSATTIPLWAVAGATTLSAAFATLPAYAQRPSGTSVVQEGGNGGGKRPLVRGAMTGVGNGMNEEQIRDLLEAKGYTDLVNLRRDGGIYSIDAAKRYGKPVSAIEVDAGTGQVGKQQPLDEAQIKSLLRRHGFMRVGDVRKENGLFTTQAERNGRLYDLQVDPVTEHLTPGCE